jgi:hypothetical protein
MHNDITLRNIPALESVAKLIAVGNAPPCGCSTEHEANAGQCPMAQPEFPRFFAGQCVQPEDLGAIEQRVFTHEQLRARHTIGWGIACGFRVAIDGTPDSDQVGVLLKNAQLRVESGYGLDRFGRDVYLAANRSQSLETLLAEREARIKQAMGDPWCAIPGCQPTPPTHFCVAVRYKECPDKPVPSYAQQCGTPKTVCEYSRIREDVEIRIFGDNEFPPVPRDPSTDTWCGVPAADASLVRMFLDAITIPHGATDVASSSAWQAYTTLAANVATAANLEAAVAQRGNCEDLLHLPRPCEPCMDWPWIPIACFTLRGSIVVDLDCRVRRTIYSLQELEALVVRLFCYLVHDRVAGTGRGANQPANLGALLNLFR